ncbi:MAG TPA: histidine kinase, partial [Pyrinomonadaceae bacterium]|nr:histidine kinase [Pyrinomonadaceae bacterium]
ERGCLRKSFLVHLVTSILFSIIEMLLFILAAPLFGFSIWKGSFGSTFTSVFTIDFHINVLIYFAILCVALALDYYRKYRERELKALQLEAKSSQLKAQLAQAHLSALKMQLHPHFLFNTLNTIVVLIRKRRDQEAEDMLTGLSELLRYALDNMGVQEVTLRRELEFIDRYLDIEQVRFNDRLKIQTRIDDEVLDALVPNLVLQPLVENAIRHGVGKRADAGLIEIRAKREDGHLHIRIRDDGPGLSKGGANPNGKGIGIANTRARLQRLYGVEQKLDLDAADGGGTVVALQIPFHLTEDSEGRYRDDEED